MPINLIAAAIVAAGFIISAMFGRYEIERSSTSAMVVHRIDRLTGKVETCFVTASNSSSRYTPPQWCVSVRD